MTIDPAVRRLVLGALIGIGAVLSASAQPAALGASVDSLLDHARGHNPELAAMRLEAVAATQRVQPAGALPDPVLRVELENINNYGNDARPNLLPARVGDTKYTVIQPLPAWGKRDLRRDVAAADAQQAGARAAATWSELAARIKAAYAQYYLAAANVRLTQEILDLMARLEQVAQARYAGGLAAQQDAIRAQLEQTAMRSELIALDNEKRQLRVRLNTLLARDAAAPLAEPQSLRPLPALTVLDTSALASRARNANPSLQAEEARLLGAEKNRELTRRNRYPDLQVGVVPTQVGSRITTWGVMVEMNIPLQQSSRRAQEREAEAMVGAARSRSEAVANQLLGELGESLAGIEAAKRSETLVATQQLPQAELSFRSALAAYENGKVDFATLLDAQRQIRKARLDRLKAQVEAQLRLAETERILGEDL
ncbi:TolC family protein [Variovorax sp. JS1663]|uniref:TolC family protein n=1 Tax=Variovorax sp. JS1663 TaxID=1851577 RepID=UPI000B345825|nr:TolC family protein [Variovorax sp. JS1663]OUM00435.1 transporter [Variovorax sp. JS1663]